MNPLLYDGSALSEPQLLAGLLKGFTDTSIARGRPEIAVAIAAALRAASSQ